MQYVFLTLYITFLQGDVVNNLICEWGFVQVGFYPMRCFRVGVMSWMML